MDEAKNCTRCNGEKVTTSKGFTSLEGKVYPDRTSPCYCCQGQGVFPPIDVGAIVKLIIASQGKNKGKLRASFTSPFRSEGVDKARAYYVWRLARFHGGKDVTLPMTADMIIRGDPFQKELDALSEEVAKHSFGTDLAGAIRWGRAFGII